MDDATLILWHRRCTGIYPYGVCHKSLVGHLAYTTSWFDQWMSSHMGDANPTSYSKERSCSWWGGYWGSHAGRVP